ncbi:MAG: tail fiber domain-containing protein [Rhodospirillales bacterium]|nr:MAG: tail fiber domain-containing protein [Rhodospirillales bacterium]
MTINNGANSMYDILRVYGSSTTAFGALGQTGTITVLSAPSTGTDTTSLQFHTSNAGAESAAMTILGSGNVGIGTTNPYNTLHVHTATDVNMLIRTGIADTTAARLHALKDDGTTYIPMELAASKFNFVNGNVGIGTTTPGTKLDVVQTGTTPALQVSGGTNPLMRIVDGTVIAKLQSTGGTEGLVGTESNHPFSIRTNNTQRIFVDTTGNVGIGTTGPVSKLDVAGGARVGADATCTAAKAGMLAWNSNKLQVCTDAGTFTDIASSSGGSSQWVNGTGGAIYYNSGSVGIGVTAPSSSLEVRNSPVNVTKSAVAAVLTPSVTANGTYYHMGAQNVLEPVIASGITNSGYMIGTRNDVYRNYVVSGDKGTLQLLYGMSIGYGHYNTDATASPTTTRAVGLVIAPLYNSGTITDMYDIYLSPDGTGGTVTNRYGIYQANTAKNYFGGNVGIGTTPTNKLTVGGLGNAEGIQLVSGVANHTLFIGDVDDGTNRYWAITPGTGATQPFVINSASSGLNYNLWVRNKGGSYNYVNIAHNDTYGMISTSNATPLVLSPGSGSVGVGVNTPRGRLNLYGTGQTTADLDTTTGDLSNMLVLQSSNIAAGDGGGIVFGTRTVGGSTDGLWAAIKAIAVSGTNYSAGDLAISTRTLNTDTALSEKIRIKANGNVGIGTATPAAKLDVAGTGNNMIANHAYTGTNSYVPHFIGYMARGTEASPTYPLNGDPLATFQGRPGAGSSSWTGMTIVATEDQSATAQGSQIRFQTTPNGTVSSTVPRMTIDQNGNVGIGTNAPATALEVAPSISNSTIKTGGIEIQSYAVNNDWIADNMYYSGSGAPWTYRANGYAAQMYFNSGNITFRTGPSGTAGGLFTPLTALQILNNGNVGIGTTTPNEGKVEVKGGTVCVDTNSDDSATSCIASESDARLKKNVEGLGYGLDTLMKLRPVSFDWKYDDAEVLKHYPLVARFAKAPHSVGFIAQEVQKLVPEAIESETVGDKDVQYFQLDYTKIVPVVTRAVQELKGLFDTLSAKVADLAAKLADVVADVAGLKDEVKSLRSENAALKDRLDAMDARLKALEGAK